jgi:hypothetical protein
MRLLRRLDFDGIKEKGSSLNCVDKIFKYLTRRKGSLRKLAIGEADY